MKTLVFLNRWICYTSGFSVSLRLLAAVLLLLPFTQLRRSLFVSHHNSFVLIIVFLSSHYKFLVRCMHTYHLPLCLYSSWVERVALGSSMTAVRQCTMLLSVLTCVGLYWIFLVGVSNIGVAKSSCSKCEYLHAHHLYTFNELKSCLY